MDWKELNLHLDNLIPGMIITAEVAAIAWWPLSPQQIEIIKAIGGVEGVFAIGVSYGVGVLSAMLSRLIVDSLSERYIRPWVFERFVHRKRCDLKETFKDDRDYKQDWGHTELLQRKPGILQKWNCRCRAVLQKVWYRHNERCAEVSRELGGDLQEWNCVYRAVLRTVRAHDKEKYAEIPQRRAQGRLVRNLFFPLLLLAWVFPEVTVATKTILTLILFWVAPFLYAYAELNIMAEALDICLGQGLLDHSRPQADPSQKPAPAIRDDAVGAI